MYLVWLHADYDVLTMYMYIRRVYTTVYGLVRVGVMQPDYIRPVSSYYALASVYHKAAQIKYLYITTSCKNLNQDRRNSPINYDTYY